MKRGDWYKKNPGLVTGSKAGRATPGDCCYIYTMIRKIYAIP
jgi:hypothetical protein